MTNELAFVPTKPVHEGTIEAAFYNEKETCLVPKVLNPKLKANRK